MSSITFMFSSGRSATTGAHCNFNESRRHGNMKYLVLLMISVLPSCSYVSSIGTIGAKKLIKVQAGSLSGPTQTMIAILDTNSNELTFLSPMGGNGVLSSVTVAGSIVAGSYFIGKGMEKSKGDQTTINTSASATSEAQSEAIANSISNPTVIVPDPPPARLIRPPFRWGQSK